ncbi:MAG: MauE/DoxX family redox-associated membrane protein [Thermodesulfobacteriota bacterium]|nr:MauE/DoxX family redox-associated membrane protein [Thermodesulfobacteriota bacterium]
MANVERDKRSLSKQSIPCRGIIILILRLGLSGLFIYASLSKIRDPIRFKNIVVNYEVLPYWMVNITAAVLPWLEFWTGALLLIGILVRACIVIQGSLLVLFILVTGLNIARGMEFYCGCFAEDTIAGGISYWHIMFNVFWLLMAGALFILERRRVSHRFLFTHNAAR